jgi:hypothetical protein
MNSNKQHEKSHFSESNSCSPGQEIPSLYIIVMFIAVFARTPLRPVLRKLEQFRSISFKTFKFIILQSMPWYPKWHLPFKFTYWICMKHFFHSCIMSHPSPFPWFGYYNNISEEHILLYPILQSYSFLLVRILCDANNYIYIKNCKIYLYLTFKWKLK